MSLRTLDSMRAKTLAGLVGLVGAAGLAACSHAPPHKPGEEYLKAIRFEGNHDLGNTDLVTGLALHRTQAKGRAPDPYLISVDADRIRGEYLRHGFLDVDVRSRVERKGEETTVIYTVDEGVRAQTRVVINGLPQDPELPVQKVREVIPLKDGAPFDYEQFDLVKDQLRTVAEDAGYARASLDAQVVADRANHTAVIQLDYDTGPKCIFGPITIEGVNGPLEQAVKERLTFHPGQPYSAQAMLTTQRNLYALGRFSTVRVSPDKDSLNPIVQMKVSVAQSARHEVRLGGGFGIEPTAYEVRGRAGYTIAGWPFPLDTVTLDLRPAYARLRDGSGYEPRIRALAKLERQDFLWTYATGEVEVGYNYLAVEAYTSYGPHARLGFATPLPGLGKLQLRVGWGIEQAGFRRISPVIDDALQMRLGLDQTERVGAFDQALVMDLRDHPIEPTLGFYGEMKVREGGTYAGGTSQFIEMVPDLRGYIPLFGGAVLAARVRSGGFQGDIPVTERFFAGGASSQRGFSERRLSPYVQGDVAGTHYYAPYGGGAMIETGAEARIPFTTVKKMPLGGVLFLDGADVTETVSDLQPTNLHWALGAGLRLLTIVGPIRFDVGYRLNRKGGMEPDPGSNMAFHLSIGEAY